MTNQKPDIICAVATSPGKSALAMIRLSGDGCIKLASKAIPALATITAGDTRKLFHDFIYDSNGSPIDEITAIPYFAPKSYSGEEMVEIICHGGFMASQTIIRLLVSLGTRIAEPGEFTKRAFLNGRISLSQAESVAAAIEAKSELALRAAAMNLKGQLHERLEKIRSDLVNTLAQIEAEIDFSDEEIEKTSSEKITPLINRLILEAENILSTYDFGRGLNYGYKIAIVGKTNVGKSSLLNALLRRERAIVTDIPGTTRDTLTEWIAIKGFPILLTDTAGLRTDGDAVEQIGQNRTRDEIERADIILFLNDCSALLDNDDRLIAESIKNKHVILVKTKRDLIPAGFAALTQNTGGNQSSKESWPTVSVSALKGDGLEELKDTIANELHLEKFSLESAVLATERQFRAMTLARQSFIHASDELRAGQSMEVIALFLRESLEHLGELVGETTNEDILENIFSHFCIGK